MPYSGHIPRMILALPWSQSDNNNNNNNDNNNNNNNNNMNNENNSAIFIWLLDTNPKSPALLNATRDISDGWIGFCHCNYMIQNRYQ